MRRRLIAVLLSLAAAPVCVVLAYYFAAFLPHQDEARKFLSSEAATYSAVAGRLRPLIASYEGESGLNLILARGGIAESKFNWREAGDIHLGMLGWHLNAFMWVKLIDFQYSEMETTLLWCHYYWGVGPDGRALHGLNDMAQAHYGKAAQALNDLELAHLVVALRTPSQAWRNAQMLDEVAKHLLKRASNET